MFFDEWGQKIYKIQHEVFTENKNILKVLSYLAPNQKDGTSFLDLKFELELDETLQVAKTARELCKCDLRAFLYLSSYL